MKKYSITLFGIFAVLFFACDREEFEEPVTGENIFSASELDVLHQVLNLQSSPSLSQWFI